MNTALSSLISLAGLTFIIFGPYNRYRIDRFRHEIFSIRDNLFLAAADGKISFDSHAYLTTRTMLNGMIRFAYQISLVRLLISSRMISSEDVKPMHDEIARMMGKSSEQDRVLCAQYTRRANLALAHHLMTSPFMLVLLVPLAGMILKDLGSKLADAVAEIFKKRLAALDELFYAEGKSTHGSAEMAY